MRHPTCSITLQRIFRPALILLLLALLGASPAVGQLTINSNSVLPPAALNTSYNFLFTASGGAGPQTWSITVGSAAPPGLTLSPVGLLSGTPNTAGIYLFSVTVQDNTGSRSSTFSMAIGPSAVQINTSSNLPAGGVGTPYNFSLIASGGSPGYTWQLLSGSLPGGLSLAPTGAITGTPTTVQLQPPSFTVRVTDLIGLTASASFSLAVFPPAPALSCPVGSATVGTSYSSSVGVSGGLAPFNFSLAPGAGALPSGLSLNQSTGAITGTPTQFGTFPISFSVIDSLQTTATASCSLTVAPSPLVLACPASTATAGAAYTSAVTPSGGVSPYSNFSVVSGSLPSALTLNQSTGAITGSPSVVGQATMTFSASDARGTQATANCSINVASAPAPLLLACPAGAGAAGSPYSSALVAFGGVGAYNNYSVASGSLPTGVALNSVTGVLTGTPLQFGSFQIGFSVRDSLTSTTTNCSLNVAAPPPLTIGCPVLGVVDTPYFFALPVSGGLPPYQNFTLASGSLPQGLSLSPQSGAISGIPIQTGTFPITVSVKDSLNTTATSNCSLIVNQLPTPLALACPASTGVVNSPYSSAVIASGGSAPYSGFTVYGGSLPPGLSVNSATGAITGSPSQAGSYSAVFLALDRLSSSALSASCPFTISAPPPLLTLACPASIAAIGAQYFSGVAASGGVQPYRNYAVSSGALPQGLSLNSNTGAITGSPLQAGSFPVGFSVGDQTQTNTAIANCSITVPGSPSNPLQPGVACPAGLTNLGATYSSAVIATGGTQPYTLYSITSGSLPPGLSLNPSTGAITGQSRASGFFPLTLAVTDSASQTGSRSCSIQVNSPTNPLTLTGSCSNIPFPIDKPVSVPLNITGGSGAYHVRLTSPAWMSLTQINGEYIATATPPGPGTHNIAASVTDDSGGQAQFGCSVRVMPRLEVQGSCPTTVQQGSTLTLQLAALGGQPPYTWKIDAPGWLQLTVPYGFTNQLTGIPPLPGNVPFTVSITDSINSNAGSISCQVQVLPTQLVVTPSSPCPTNRLPAGQPFSQALSAAGGSNSYKWTLSGPQWLQLTSSQGVNTSVSGTVPDTGGTFSYTVQLLDAAGSGQSQYSCQFDTFPGLSIQSSLPASLALNQSATLTFNGFGGQPPYRWSVNGPPWLSPNQSGALLQLVGAPPSADPFDCTVTLTDSIGSAPAKANCALPVREPGLQIAGAVCPSTPSFLGRPYALTVNATGGAGPYTWVFRGPGFLTPTTPSTGTVFTISGTPDRPGEFDYSIELRDAAGIVQTFACKLTVIVPPIPQIQIVGLNLTADLLQDITVGIQLSEPTPIPLEIELQLNFISTAPGVTDNPQVQFLDPTATNSGKRLRFFIPQGSSASSTARIRGGTIAGIIRIQVFTVSTGGVAIDAANRPSRDVTIPSIRPVITDLQFTDETAGGFTLVISGFSTPRDMSQLIVTLTPRAGGSLNGTTTFTIPLTDLFRTYFNSAASLDVGSGFVLRLPITIQGDKAQVGAVSIQLSNSVGQSDTFTRNR